MNTTAVSDVSIVIAAFNAAGTLETTLKSALAQSLRPARIIVVDDGSTDDTAALCAKFGDKITYLYQDNRGQGAARNLGLTLVDTDHVMFVDADDLMAADAIACLRPLASISPYQIAHGSLELMDRSGASLGPGRFARFDGDGAAVARVMLEGGTIPPVAWLLPTGLVRQVGGNDDTARLGGEDLALLLRCCCFARFASTASVVGRYRVSPGSFSSDLPRMARGELDARLAFLTWAKERSVLPCSLRLTEIELIEMMANRAYYVREWRYFRILLREARRRGWHSRRLRLLTLAALFPPVVFETLERLQDLRRQKGSFLSSRSAIPRE